MVDRPREKYFWRFPSVGKQDCNGSLYEFRPCKGSCKPTVRKKRLFSRLRSQSGSFINYEGTKIGGVYFCRLQAGEFVESERMVLIQMISTEGSHHDAGRGGRWVSSMRRDEHPIRNSPER